MGKVVGITWQAHRMVRPFPAYNLGGGKGATPPTSLALGHLPSRGGITPEPTFLPLPAPQTPFLPRR